MAAAIWMAAVSVATCAAVAALGRGAVMPEAAAGMLAPLVSAVASWLVIVRVHATAPERLTGVLMAAFAIKAVLFGAYIVVALAVLDLRPMPFVAAFTSYYVALHIGEALLLKRLLAAGERARAGSQPHN
jgi:hypothetical protein